MRKSLHRSSKKLQRWTEQKQFQCRWSWYTMAMELREFRCFAAPGLVLFMWDWKESGSLAQFILAWDRLQQKIISCFLFLYWDDWFLSGHDIRNCKCYKSMILWLATSESWWISMGLRSLTIGKMLEDQSGRQQAQWGSPVRAVWFVLLMWRSCCATNGVLIRRKCSWVVIACSCVTCLHNPWTWVFLGDVMVAKFNTRSPKPLAMQFCWHIVGHWLPWRVSMIWAYVH